MWPSISVVMPIRNEADYIEQSLGAMLAQNYPGEMEIVCVDGMSQDGTRDIVQQIATKDFRVRLMDNPKGITPVAMNVGVHAARYDLIARMDGHTIAPRNYLRKCVDFMQQTRADCVGGRVEYSGETFIAQAIGAAMESPFGAGTARWRSAKNAGEVDTVPFGMYRRQQILALGGFDERLIRNQDYEFNYRLREKNGHIFFSPDIACIYHSRQNLTSLWRQYHQYGLWKARTVRMHPASFRMRHMFAPLFVMGLVIGIAFSWTAPIWRWMYLLYVCFYLLLGCFFSLRQAARRGWRYLPFIPLVFATLHVAWGSGFLMGLWRWWVRQKP
jgi:succinoglycan biosynthesis protein ExoA